MTTLDWNSSIRVLFQKEAKTLSSLLNADILTLRELAWILPLHFHELSTPSPFPNRYVESIFTGKGIVQSIQSSPAKQKGRGKVQLVNATTFVKDSFGHGALQFRWFNLYPSQLHKIHAMQGQEVIFYGDLSIYGANIQIVNPTVIESIEELPSTIIQYPTINKVPSHRIQNLIKKIPSEVWVQPLDPFTKKELETKKLLPLSKCLQMLHGIIPSKKEERDMAKARMIYQEFFDEQILIGIRKEKRGTLSSVSLNIPDQAQSLAQTLFPFDLTDDQKNCLDEISNDFKKSSPMMRLIQGDVGSGKTAVALAAAFQVIQANHQVALMCPTESLALQHYDSVLEVFKGRNIESALLIGSTTQKKKKHIYEDLKSGKIQLIVGTHALIQDKVEIPHLGLAIIDEQHKFGVKQRLALTNKRQGAHSLIMTATPIPRSLRLTQYGDLELSIIKSMPKTRAGNKTRIVNQETYSKFLSFVKTRLEMKEQAYILVPAIEENEEHDLLNLEKVYAKYSQIFKEYRIATLHGRQKPEEKEEVLQKFHRHEIDLLICTSVVEVGINVHNATIMGILNPERFGLSSLHQLRGRVGRGPKMGFCFLVNDRRISRDSQERLQVIERSNDGFYISEKDLELRGEGNLFGKEQSGQDYRRRYASLFHHYAILEQARTDCQNTQAHQSPEYQAYLNHLLNNPFIRSTI